MFRTRNAVLVLVSAVALVAACNDMPVSSPTLTSAPVHLRELREEHADLSRRLDEAEGSLGRLASEPSAADARTRMQKLVVFFTVQFGDQGRLEERRLYDLVDGRIDGPPLTTTLRHEHVVMARWTGELDLLAKAEPLDVPAFVRRGQQLVGLCRAHVEVEGRLLEPLLVKLGDFDREIERRAVPHAAPPR